MFKIEFKDFMDGIIDKYIGVVRNDITRKTTS